MIILNQIAPQCVGSLPVFWRTCSSKLLLRLPIDAKFNPAKSWKPLRRQGFGTYTTYDLSGLISLELDFPDLALPQNKAADSISCAAGNSLDLLFNAIPQFILHLISIESKFLKQI